MKKSKFGTKSEVRSFNVQRVRSMDIPYINLGFEFDPALFSPILNWTHHLQTNLELIESSNLLSRSFQVHKCNILEWVGRLIVQYL